MAQPKRELYKSSEVCEVAEVQPFVLRSWEKEFPNLGQATSGGGPRVYKRADLEMVLRIKALVFDEGLTLAGARRRLDESEEPVARSGIAVDERLGARARERVRFVRDGLKSILEMLSADPRPELMLVAPSSAPRRAAKSTASRSKGRGG